MVGDCLHVNLVCCEFGRAVTKVLVREEGGQRRIGDLLRCSLRQAGVYQDTGTGLYVEGSELL